MPDGTPLRNVRVADDLWHAAMSKALDRGETLSEVIRRALEKYVKG
jgi:predicted HicB family RNase H-like nuclease